MVLIGLIAAAVLLLAPPGAPDSSAPPVSAPSSSPDDEDSDEDSAGGGPGGDGGAAPTPEVGPSPGATPVDGSEVPAPTDPTAPVNRLPELPQPAPLVEAPLPESAFASGELVSGFPAAVAGPAPGDQVLESSVASDGGTMQAALKARSDASPETVATHFRQAWADLGLTTTGNDEIAASDPFTAVTLAISQSGTGTIYTVFATLRTE